MPIANYTTEVSALKSVGEIQGILVAHGAKSIIINYDASKQPESLSFLLPTAGGDIGFSLPANIAKVEKLLLAQRKTPPQTWQDNYKATMTRIHEQAYRVGWRILKDWVRAQTAIVETEMVTIEQIFLPYMQVDEKRTLYQVLEERKFYLPGPK